MEETEAIKRTTDEGKSLSQIKDVWFGASLEDCLRIRGADVASSG